MGGNSESFSFPAGGALDSRGRSWAPQQNLRSSRVSSLHSPLCNCLPRAGGPVNMSAPREDREVGRWPRAWGSYGQWSCGEDRNPYWSGRGSYSCQTHDERKGLQEIDPRASCVPGTKSDLLPCLKAHPTAPGSGPTMPAQGSPAPAVAQTCPASSLHLEVLPRPSPYSPDHVRLPRAHCQVVTFT